MPVLVGRGAGGVGLVQRRPQGLGQLLDHARDRVGVGQQPAVLLDGVDLGLDLGGDRQVGGVSPAGRSADSTGAAAARSGRGRFCQSAISWASRSLFSWIAFSWSLPTRLADVGRCGVVSGHLGSGASPPAASASSFSRLRNSAAWTDSWPGWVFSPIFLNRPRSSISCDLRERDRLDPELGGGDVLLVQLALGDRLGAAAGLQHARRWTARSGRRRWRPGASRTAAPPNCLRISVPFLPLPT